MEIRTDAGELFAVITDEEPPKKQTSFTPDWLPTGEKLPTTANTSRLSASNASNG